MLTPVFELIQCDRFLKILIKAPYAKISDAEIYVDECDFKFYAKPYFLRLTLPGAIVEDGSETAKYDSDKGVFNIQVKKAKQGEIFEGLDMLTKLLAPTKIPTTCPPAIEVLSETANADETDTIENGEDLEEEDDFDWQIEQVPYSEPELSTNGPKYGFANRKSGVFIRLQSELLDLIDLKDADSTPWQKRKPLKEDAENEKFDEDHYLADFCDEDGSIKHLLKFKPEWRNELDEITQEKDPDCKIQITEEEREKMLKLPKKKYLLDVHCQQMALLSLVDIIFAYVYNHIVTEGESMVESGWNISKISSTLSWLEVPSSLHEVIRSSYRRCLCYPLYRNWALTEKVFKEVRCVFQSGRKRLLKCLLEIHSIFNECDQRYILNDLYITDYCVWIQSVSKKHLESLSKHLHKIHIKKTEVGFDVTALEQIATISLQENDRHLVQDFSSMNLAESQSCINDSQHEIADCRTELSGTELELASSTDSETESSTDYCTTSDSEENYIDSDENENTDQVHNIHENTEQVDKIHENIEQVDKIHEKTEQVDKIHEKTEQINKIHEKTEQVDKIHEKTEQVDKIHENTEQVDKIHENTEQVDKIKVQEASDKTDKQSLNF